MKTWVTVDKTSDFSIKNIPFGVITTKSNQKLRPAIRIGEYVLDLEAFAEGGGFSKASDINRHASVFQSHSLNPFMALGRGFCSSTRLYLQTILREDTPFPDILRDNKSLQATALVTVNETESHLPITIGSYTDFYACRNHAFNVGVLFRGEKNALQPNYSHMPIAYNGRATSVVTSGTPIHRPWGQILRGGQPILSPSQKLDYELELGMFVCKGNKLGEPVSVEDGENYIFGYVLLNDWSARDLQAWEYVPLGPFTAKNFGTTISPWVVLADALEPFRTSVASIGAHPSLSYLIPQRGGGGTQLDIHLKIELRGPNNRTSVVSQTNALNLAWSWPQMIAHHTISGCNLQPGDLFGSGTISGTNAGSEGSLLEQTKNGKEKITVGAGERAFLEDGDTIIMSGWAGGDHERVGFGECSGTILPAIELLAKRS